MSFTDSCEVLDRRGLGLPPSLHTRASVINTFELECSGSVITAFGYVNFSDGL